MKGMRRKSVEKKERINRANGLKEEEDEKALTREEINALIEKHKNIKPKPTIIGKGTYDPFLVGDDDTWMSVGDKINDD